MNIASQQGMGRIAMPPANAINPPISCSPFSNSGESQPKDAHVAGGKISKERQKYSNDSFQKAKRDDNRNSW